MATRRLRTRLGLLAGLSLGVALTACVSTSSEPPATPTQAPAPTPNLEATVAAGVRGTLAALTPSPVPTAAQAAAPAPPATAQPRPTRRRESEDERRQRLRTNQLGKDAFETEGGVIATHCDRDPQEIVIGTLDGEVTLKLFKVKLPCESVRPGDYLLVTDAEKQHEHLYKVHEIEIEGR